jgi:hypothetical protein
VEGEMGVLMEVVACEQVDVYGRTAAGIHADLLQGEHETWRLVLPSAASTCRHNGSVCADPMLGRRTSLCAACTDRQHLTCQSCCRIKDRCQQ